VPDRTFHLADLWELVADAVPERTALVCGQHRRTYAELEERSNRLAHWMADRGVGKDDFVGLYLRNSPAYVEATLAAYKLRAVPINVNFRYVDDELRYLFDDAGLVGVIHDEEFTPRVETVAAGVPSVRWNLADGAAYADAVSASKPDRDFGPRSDDDLYVIYTGGTTGMPKGVVWRIRDAFFACMAGGDPSRMKGDVEQPEDLLDRIVPEYASMSVAPLMHAAGGWTTFMWLFAGAKVVILPGSFDPDEVWATVERERVNGFSIVGDAMARPLLDAWDAAGGKYDISSLFLIGSGGAPLTPPVKARLGRTFPNVIVGDGFGSSETGIQGASRFTGAEGGPSKGGFTPSATVVLDEDTLEPVEPGSGRIGKVARTGLMPLRYHGDPEKTAATFVDVGGTRYAISGDMATVEADGTVTLLGRGSQCINTGGEKVFPEEVEAALRGHDAVYDVLVVGAPDERWGQRVVAVVQRSPGRDATEDDLRQHCRASVAGYKVPKQVIFVDQVVRSPAGKADYRWAAQVATQEVRKP
jgi:acyl-CoA synthetase (AMP-forming)/AMP-acid ligase II